MTRHRRQRLRIACVLAAATFCIDGCITTPANPAATQPATAIDAATTRPSYYLDQPSAAHVSSPDFQTLWNACEDVARSWLFTLDRQDYRLGLLTTQPLVSRQFFEFWRPDTGTAAEVCVNSIATIRRSIRFEFVRNSDNTFTVTPKVLVERETVLERRMTSVVNYTSAFGGPAAPVQFSTNLPATVPPRYWLPISRDPAMESDLASAIRHRLK